MTKKQERMMGTEMMGSSGGGNESQKKMNQFLHFLLSTRLFEINFEK